MRTLGVHSTIFLGPVHPQIVVHPAVVEHLELSGVPEIVVGLGVFKLGKFVEDFALIPVVLGDGGASPVVGAGGVVVVGLVADEVDGELAPGDEFVEVAVAGGFEVGMFCGGGVDGEGDGQWADVAEVEVRGHHAGAVDFGVVAVAVVGGEHLGRKSGGGV